MSDKVKFTLTKDNIHLSFDGKHSTVSSQHKLYGQIRDLLREGREDEVPELFEQKAIAKSLEEYVKDSGLVLVGSRLRDRDGELLPEVLSTRLQEIKEDGFDVSRLVKFWDNLKQNPSMNSREQLYKFLEQKGHPLTDDGCFIAYRGVNSNFGDLHTGKFDNSPGQVLEMDRSQVDDNPNRTCSYGFHVAAWGYASTFGPVTVEVKVNPRDVVAVPADYNGQKMRVCKFEVIQQCKSMRDTTQVEPVYQENRNWDADEDDLKNYDEDDVAEVISLAQDYSVRYSDRNVLAVRIEEDYSCLSVGDILEILNDNESEWLNSGDSDDCDGSCLACGCMSDEDESDDQNDQGDGDTGMDYGFKLYW